MKRFFLVGLVGLGWGRHIAGADLYYRCIDASQNRYEFELWLYRDCTDPQGADYDNPITVYIFGGNGSLYTTRSVTLSGSGPWNPQGVDRCFLQRPGTCLEEGVYRFELVLPPRTDGYYVAWARCCRNATITNLDAPLNMGITYLAQIPPARRAPCNSSPRFVQRPPFFLCAGHDFFFNHAAVDVDGDSLVYQIVGAYHSVNLQGQGAVNPSQGGLPTVGPTNPLGPPPYQIVTYAPGYSATQPFGTGGICQIDPSTGLLHLKAPNPGLYVVAIAVLEFRNGAFLGETRRDMQFYVAPCRPPTAAPLVEHDFSGLLHRGDTLILEAEQNICFSATIRDTQPPSPPATLSYSISPPPSTVQSAGSNPLLLSICISPSCQDTGKLIPLYISGYKTELCGTTQAHDTIWIRVLSPPRRSLWGVLAPLPLPQQNGAYQIHLDSTACAQFWIVAEPPHPPPTISYTTSTPAQITLSTTQRGDTLFGELCYTGKCEALTQPIVIALRGVASASCQPLLQWQDTLRFLVLLPQNPPPTVSFIAPDTIRLKPDSGACLRLRIEDLPPLSKHSVHIRSEPPLLQNLNVQPSSGSLSWESEVCFTPACEAIGQVIRLIAEVRDSLSCAELYRRYDTLFVRVESRPTYPLALEVPPWTREIPFQAFYKAEYCFPIVAKDTAGNGGEYALEVSATEFPIEVRSAIQQGDSIRGEVCFRLNCLLRGDTAYPIIVRALNRPYCAVPPPATVETVWVRPANLPHNRPPTISRDKPSPWEVIPSEDSLCYTLLVEDPDSFALLTYEGRGAAFSPEFFWGAHFTLSALGENPLLLRACAQINCYTQGQTFPVVICVKDTTSCDPSEQWEVCDTLELKVSWCHGILPNVFTPNGDGINDLLRPYDLAGVSRWRLLIWNRWGEQVFAGDWNEPWRGETSAGPAPEGVYFYLLKLQLVSGKGPPLDFDRAGSITLLR
ncbi:MAG: gliding motility-associated C-terminal domain-containing protein [Bacteroidia bacterium]|nr:gliding motility-associated C-terminal domain-containing protein [Bacteroidia bacterium]